MFIRELENAIMAESKVIVTIDIDEDCCMRTTFIPECYEVWGENVEISGDNIDVLQVPKDIRCKNNEYYYKHDESLITIRF